MHTLILSTNDMVFFQYVFFPLERYNIHRFKTCVGLVPASIAASQCHCVHFDDGKKSLSVDRHSSYSAHQRLPTPRKQFQTKYNFISFVQ